MKNLLCLLAAFLALPAFAIPPNAYLDLRGSYAAVLTAKTAGTTVAGDVKVSIAAPKKRPGVALISITGNVSPIETVPGTGNATPVKMRLKFRGGRVIANNFLFGLGAERQRAVVSRLRGKRGAYRFTLRSAAGDGRLHYTLAVKDGVLTIVGSGTYRAAGGEAQRIHLLIAPPAPETT